MKKMCKRRDIFGVCKVAETLPTSCCICYDVCDLYMKQNEISASILQTQHKVYDYSFLFSKATTVRQKQVDGLAGLVYLV